MNRSSVIKRNILNVSRYQMSIILLQLVIFILNLILNYSIGLIIGAVSDTQDAGGGSLDIVAIIYGLIFGILFFASSFKFALVNGVSRNSLFISCILTLALSSFALTSVCGVLMCTPNAGNTFNLYFILYGKDYVGLFPWLFCAMIMTQMLGWFIAVFFYRASKRTKLIVLAAILLVVPLFLLFNLIDNGALGRALFLFLKLLLGITSSTTSPFISIGFSLAISAILLVGVKLMLRRAVVR